MTAHINDIIGFWRGAGPEKWFKKVTAFDEAIRLKFEPTHHRAARGEYDAWAESPDGALAHIILCDQFPRNMHRKTARAFAGDAKALETARLALARSYPTAFNITMRLFFYMPFQHSESLGDQELGCALFAAFEDEETTKHAVEHRDLIERFGRFPHRNDALGRACTPDELDYLKTGKRFGQ